MELLSWGLLLCLSVLTVKCDPMPDGGLQSGAEDQQRKGLPANTRAVMGYSDSWAVEVDGGGSEAERIAEANGLVNLGKVEGLENVYHFALPSNEEVVMSSSGRTVKNRGGTNIIGEMQEKTAQLNADQLVRGSTQQKAFRMEKRGYFTYPSDPLWYQQWALYDNEEPGKDLNVLAAWIQGYTGKGVVVTVVDDGLQKSHPDLSRNFDADASYNYMESISDPSPYNAMDSHGTSCAGEIGMARDNNYCGVGVAYNCKLGGIRVNLNYLTDIVEAKALTFQRDYVDIYSNSWGPPDNGFLVQGPGYYSDKALKEGVTKGRNGLGSVFVWAAGNGGRNDDSCAADGYASSIYTIAVGSASPQGKAAYFDEYCSGKMAVTFSYNSHSFSQVVSTSPQSKCTTSFTGTSASAPLLAGVVALMLESNPDLTWRDVQYLIAYTSNPECFQSAQGWSTNGAGLRVSHQFGFGVIDAEALVTRAQHWTSVPQQETCTIKPSSSSNSQAKSDDPIELTFSVDNSCDVVSLEHVVVRMTLSITVQSGGTYSYSDYYDDPDAMYHNGARRGDISVEVYSPQGTRSVLLPERSYDFVNDEGYSDWPFMSVLHWGEDPSGDWELVVHFSSDAGYVSVSDPSMVLYGTSSTPDSVRRIPEECDAQCVRGCADEGEEFCDSCKSHRIQSTLRCVTTCPGDSAGNYSEMGTAGDESESDSCAIGGYCIGCEKSLLPFSIPIMVILAVSGVVLIVGSLSVAYVLWTKFCQHNTDYMTI